MKINKIGAIIIKKLFTLMLLTILTIGLVGCQSLRVDNEQEDNDDDNDNDIVITDEQILEDALDSLGETVIPSTINNDIELPNSIEDVSIGWESSDPHFLTSNGIYNPPLYRSGEKEVTLTARATYNEQEMTRDFYVTLETLPEPTVSEIEELSFTNIATEYLLDDTMINVYYTEPKGLPYVDVESFLTLLDGGTKDGAIVLEDVDIIINENTLSIEYFADNTSDLEPGEEPLMEDMTYSIEFDFDNNLVTVSHFDFFGAYQQATQTDFGAGLSVADYTYEYSSPVVFDLNAYRLDTMIHEDEFLIPLHLANLFFSGSMYDVYYNGDELIGFDTYQRYDVEDDLRTSSINGEEMTWLKALRTYNYTVFTFDYYYGLRYDQDVETYYDVFDQEALTSENHDAAVWDLAYSLDDLHTSHLMYGYHSDEPTKVLSDLADVGERTQSFYYDLWDLQDMNLCSYKNNVTYYDDRDVARIRVTGFDEDTPDEFAKLMDKINDDGTATKIIVDISCNTGGIVGGMIQVLGYMTDDLLPIHGLNTGDMSTYTAYYDSETEALDYDWYVLSGPITFSAGNMMAQVSKELDNVTVIGEDSKGGAASITTNILPSGAIIIMSSNNLSADADYNSIEMGVEVDYHVDMSDFNNESAIMDAINSAVSERSTDNQD
ncbi:MAG: S41 family peptidase [Bacillota bacterium]